MDDGVLLVAEVWSDFDRGVDPGRRGAANQNRLSETRLAELLRDRDHLVERRRNQAAETDDIDPVRRIFRHRDNSVVRDHNPHINHFIVVATEHDANNILADVVDVALDRRHEDSAVVHIAVVGVVHTDAASEKS